jgi:metallo-beta-lactamase family protein
MKTPWGTITFHGAAGDVTGANFMLDIAGKKILVDCGLHQGTENEFSDNWKPFAYNPADIDILFVTHAHTDHIGKVPKLVRDGFRGVIYSTEPTKNITRAMFSDMLGLLTTDAKEAHLPKLWDERDIERAMSLWKAIPYHNKLDLGEGLSVMFYDAGHVLGSAMVLFTHNNTSMLFTGDLGNSPNILLRDTETFIEPDYVLMESVYGDRNHEGVEDRTRMLADAIIANHEKGGTLMIPAFSLERTQEMLYELNNLIEGGKVPKTPVYLDSPLAIELTNIYRKSTEFFNPAIREVIHGGDDIFMFPGFHVTKTVEQSKSINGAPDPKIIIAGSGMMNGGRILHHAKFHLPDPKNTLLLVGYQAVGTLGRLIQSGQT